MHLKLQFLVSMGSFLFGPDVGRLAVYSRRYVKATGAAFTKKKGRGGLFTFFYAFGFFFFFLRKDNSLLLFCIK